MARLAPHMPLAPRDGSDAAAATGLGLVIGAAAAATLHLLAVPAASALPMSYAGSTTVGIDVDPHWSTTWFTRALDRRNGLGMSLQVLPGNASHAGDAVHSDESFALMDATRLLKRWNMPKAQANVWLFGGVGVYRAGGSDGSAAASHLHWHGGTQGSGTDPDATSPALRIAARPGMQVDIETTRLRLEGRGQLFVAPGVQRPLLSATAGAALTPPTYDGIQPWLELQLRAMPGVADQLELIPKLRLLHQRLVLEIGYSSLGSVVGGLTYTF